MNDDLTTDVLIVGAGPAGLMLAIELGCRGVACIVLEEDAGAPQLPKANATSARTMEHYRRRGFADEIRALGLPSDHPQDVTYHTRLVGIELARFRMPSRDEAAAQGSFGDYGEQAWPTPELPHRAQQMYIEPVLARQAGAHPTVRVLFGHRATSVGEDATGVAVAIDDLAAGRSLVARARYVVGCDGPKSLVRRTIGVGYSGQGSEMRDFMGGQMASVYFRSAELYRVIAKPKAWQYWVVNPKKRGLMVVVNGIDTFVVLVQLKQGQTIGELDVRQALLDVVGAEFEHEVLDVTPWTAGYALVADRFRQGRLLLAGDAAHLFTPAGGMGYNTSVDDAVNLGWKLAAVLQGWAPEALLASYEAERQPVAVRNTAFARAMADSIGKVSIASTVDDDSAEGAAARASLGRALDRHVASEFNNPGLQLGVRYASAIVATEFGEPPADAPGTYIPSTWPGARAPHVRLGVGAGADAREGGRDASLLDRFGRDFTLVARTGTDTAAWEAAAARSRLPLAIVRSDEPRVQALYTAELVLVRPDHHIAWRGPATADAAAVLGRAVGVESAPCSDTPSPRP